MAADTKNVTFREHNHVACWTHGFVGSGGIWQQWQFPSPKFEFAKIEKKRNFSKYEKAKIEKIETEQESVQRERGGHPTKRGDSQKIPWQLMWMMARKKVQTPFYIPCYRHTLYSRHYVLLIPLSLEFFPIFEWNNEYIFEKTVPTISVCNLLFVGTCTNFRCVTRKWMWPLHASYRYVRVCLPKHLTFEGGWVHCGGKTVSTRAHIRKEQQYLCKRTLQANYDVFKTQCLWRLLKALFWDST